MTDRIAALADSDAFVHAPVAYSILDLEGRQVASNPAFRELFGLDDDLVRVADITHPDELERTTGYLEALAAGTHDRVEVDKRYLRADGTTFWGRLTARALLDDDGRPALLLGVIEDISTQMDTLQQLTAVSRAKSEFVARVSHDLRTPLHAISGLAELLEVADLPPEHRSFADAIGREADALRVLVDDLLDLSRVEAGRLEVNREVFSLATCVRVAVDLLRRRAAQRGLDLALDIADGLDRDVWGDADRLRQVLVNLLDNAIKFTPSGSIRVAVRAGTDDDVLLDVVDTGHGIAPDDVERIFEPFTQAHADQTGTGLGLGISRELVEIMGGDLRVDSTPGRGSTFTIRVPLPTAYVVDSDPGRGSDETVDPGQPLVLVVEDSPVNRLLVASQLDHLGYRHVLAADGAQALDEFRAERFDAVLMDWHLPDMDGLDTTRLLREVEVDLGRERVPVVAVTARAMSGDRQRCLDAGMDDFLAKPVGLADLDAMLRTWLPADDRLPADPSAGSVTTPGTDVHAIELLVDELGDPSIVASLVRTFLDELPGRRQAIAAGAEADDLEAVRRAAHTLKSTSAVLGATAVTDLAAGLELEARTGAGDLAPMVAELDRAVDRAVAELSTIVDGLAQR